MNKNLILFFMFAVSLGYSQSFSFHVETQLDQAGITPSTIPSGSIYTVIGHIHSDDNIAANGIIWSTNPADLTFNANKFNYPGNNVAFGSGNGFTCTIGNGKEGKIPLASNTTYYIRSYVFAGSRGHYNTYYGNIITVNTAIDSTTVLMNNLIKSGNKSICPVNGAYPASDSLIGTQPKGGNGTYTYAWQSRYDTSATWNAMANSNVKSILITPPASGTSAKIWYRRIVTSAGVQDPSMSDPVSVSYTWPAGGYSINMLRDPNSTAIAIQAKVSPASGTYTYQWQDSTAGGSFQNITNEIGTAYIASADTNTWYRVALSIGSAGCATYYSPVVGITPKDGSGNSYLYIKLINRYWMIENLRTTKFNDGTAIAKDSTAALWTAATSAGYTWYNNDTISNKYKFGALYNFYTISNNVCPAGWKVPDRPVWDTLVKYTGTATTAGATLSTADPAYWNPANSFATNKYNFNALPGGYVKPDGGFTLINQQSRFWTFTSPTAGTATGMGSNYNTAIWQVGDITKTYGLSIRCVKK